MGDEQNNFRKQGHGFDLSILISFAKGERWIATNISHLTVIRAAVSQPAITWSRSAMETP